MNKEDDHELGPMLNVRMLVESKGEFDEILLNPWQFTSDGVPYFMCKGHEFVDPRPAFGETYGKRCAFIKDPEASDGEWLMVEWCEEFLEKNNVIEMICECGQADWLCLTMVCKDFLVIDQYFNIRDEDPQRPEVPQQPVLPQPDPGGKMAR